MQYINFIHLLGAIAAGFYLLLPFFVSRLAKYPVELQKGAFKNLFVFNRAGQYIMILQFLTGGYLISQKDYTVTWMVLVIVLFILGAAMAGMMSKPMKRFRDALEDSRQDNGLLSRIVMFSTIIAVIILILIFMMSFPSYDV